MSNFIIKDATKKAKKLRMAISASSGAGKTWGALKIARGLVNSWEEIVVIDTEKGSASLYSDFAEKDPPYKVVDFTAPFSPERYIEAIRACEQAGYKVIIIDSITHEWQGTGGCLEIQQALGGRFQDWAVVTPRHNAFINAILYSKCHVICTIRRKEEYSMDKTASGKSVVRKMGLQEVQRDGFSYEMDIVFEVDNSSHMTTATKDRTRLFQDDKPFLITEETGKLIGDWVSEGLSELDTALSYVREAKEIGDLNTLYANFASLHQDEDFMSAMRHRREQLLKNNQ